MYPVPAIVDLKMSRFLHVLYDFLISDYDLVVIYI